MADSATTTPSPDWDRWFAEHGQRLFLFAQTQCRSEADAQDVLQEAVIKTWRSEANETTVPPLPHAYRAIRQCAIDLGRSLDRRTRREEIVSAEWFTEQFTQPTSGEELVPEDVQQALSRLKPDQREVITLKIWGDQTFSEVAETLDLSANTVASRYRTALLELRRQLAPQPQAQPATSPSA